MYLLDSDILSHLWARHERVETRLREVQDTEIAITSVTKCEILRARCDNLLKVDGPEEVLKAQQRLDRSERLLAEPIVAPFDEAAAQEFGRLTSIGKLKQIGRADLLIASIALASEASLVTRNLKHFRQVPGLKVENWAD
jgi:tRNA(fMet)-specific endonuclease VapC